MPIKIKAHGVTKIYPSRSEPVYALRDFNLEVQEGEFVCYRRALRVAANRLSFEFSAA